MVRPTSNVEGGDRIDNSFLQSLTETDIIALKRKPQYINAVSPVVSMKGQVVNGTYNWSTTIQGIYPEFLFIRSWPLKEGVAFTNQNVKAASKVC